MTKEDKNRPKGTISYEAIANKVSDSNEYFADDYADVAFAGAHYVSNFNGNIFRINVESLNRHCLLISYK